jgi:hypothetical protein
VQKPQGDCVEQRLSIPLNGRNEKCKRRSITHARHASGSATCEYPWSNIDETGTNNERNRNHKDSDRSVYSPVISTVFACGGPNSDPRSSYKDWDRSSAQFESLDCGEMVERSLFSLWLSCTINDLQVADGCVSPSKQVHGCSTAGWIVGCEGSFSKPF